jgi:hypothetical protein
MLDAMRLLNGRLKQEKGLHLAIRVGIHTGLAVIGEMGGGGHQEQLALGDTPNIAARLQGLAAPDTVVISDSTYRLVEGYVTCEALGDETLKGVSRLMRLYRVLAASEGQSRLDVAQRRGLTPLVGREQEVGVLLERWAQVQEGHGQVVVLSGEAGIGKSRLLQVLKEHLAEESHIRLECRSSPYYHQSALYPLIDLCLRALQASPDKLVALEQLLEQYNLATAETVPLLASLLSISLPDGHYPPLALSPQQQRRKTLEALHALVFAQAAQQPLLFILEDLHWTDMDTSEARWYQAELYRLKGALLLRQAAPDASQAESCFQQALDIARQQQARSWELRTAAHLARLWQQQGKCQEAYDLLAPVYGWFTEGFGTADLQEARALLEALS